MTLEQTTELYASVLRQLLPVGGYDASPTTEGLSVDIYAHAKLLAHADLDAKRLLNVLEGIPSELIAEYETEYGLPLKCTVNASRTVEERLQILNWVRTSRNVLNRAYLEQLLAIFGVTLIDVVKFKPLLCTAVCDSPVNTEQLRYKVFLRLQYPVNADLNCIIENYLPGYLRLEWMVDMPWGNWILNPSVTVNTNGIAHYTTYKTNQREYYDSYANLDLAAAIVRSLSDTDMQQWQAVTDAANELTGVTDWVFDPANNQIKYYTDNPPSDPKDPTYQYYWQGTVYSSTAIGTTAEDVGNKVCSMNGGTLRSDSYYIAGGAGFYIYCNVDGNQRSGHASIVANPAYDPTAESEREEYTVHFAEITQKIISNASSPNQAISLLAEAYLEAVATSISNSDESKQFVKLSDLFSQFELNKTLRT